MQSALPLQHLLNDSAMQYINTQLKGEEGLQHGCALVILYSTYVAMVLVLFDKGCTDVQRTICNELSPPPHPCDWSEPNNWNIGFRSEILEKICHYLFSRSLDLLKFLVTKESTARWQHNSMCFLESYERFQKLVLCGEDGGLVMT